MSYRLCLAFSAFLLAGCGRTLPGTLSGDRPQPLPGSRDEADLDKLVVASGLTLVPSSDVRHYLTTSTTVLQQAPDTSSNQTVISMELSFSLAYTRTLPARTRLTGTLNRISATTEGPFPVLEQPLHLPLGFTGYIVSGGLYLDSLAGSPIGTVVDCKAAGLNGITGIQRSIVVPPLFLSTGTTWTDSTTVPVCSGSIQLTLTAVRTYTVAGQTTRGLHPVVLVDRKDRVLATGEGAQGQHRVSIRSQGSGSARIYLDRTTGLLHESESTQAVDLVIGSSGRSQQFRQVVTEKTHLQR